MAARASGASETSRVGAPQSSRASFQIVTARRSACSTHGFIVAPRASGASFSTMLRAVQRRSLPDSVLAVVARPSLRLQAEASAPARMTSGAARRSKLARSKALGADMEGAGAMLGTSLFRRRVGVDAYDQVANLTRAGVTSEGWV